MAPFACQSNKDYSFLLHSNLCLRDLIWSQVTEARFDFSPFPCSASNPMIAGFSHCLATKGNWFPKPFFLSVALYVPKLSFLPRRLETGKKSISMEWVNSHTVEDSEAEKETRKISTYCCREIDGVGCSLNNAKWVSKVRNVYWFIIKGFSWGMARWKRSIGKVCRKEHGASMMHHSPQISMYSPSWELLKFLIIFE